MTETLPSSVQVRIAGTADADMLAELGRRTFRDTFAAQNTEGDMALYLAGAFTPETTAEELTDPRARFLIAHLDGNVVGYAKLLNGSTEDGISGPRPVEIVRLYAAKECIGQGVGAALMQACLSAAREWQAQTVWLGVWEHNLRAQAFYRKWGFTTVGSHVFQFGTDPQTDLLMQRDLTR